MRTLTSDNSRPALLSFSDNGTGAASISKLAYSSSRTWCKTCGGDLSFLSEHGQLNHQTFCLREQSRKKNIGDWLGTNGQDQELRQALARYLEELQRNVKELLDVVGPEGPSERTSDALSPTKPPSLTLPEDVKWKATPKGMQWLFGDDPQAQALVAAIRARPDGTLVIDNYQYKISTAKDGGRLFVNRWLHRETTK